MKIQKEPIKEGEEAKDFKLTDQNGEKTSLSNYKDQKVLLSFHPLAWTSVCRKQMESLENNYKKFKNEKTEPLGISVDPLPSKKAWSEELNLENLKILSDFWPHGKVAKKYGIFIEEKGISKRANILIDENKNIIFVKIYPMQKVPDLEPIFKTIE